MTTPIPRKIVDLSLVISDNTPIYPGAEVYLFYGVDDEPHEIGFRSRVAEAGRQ